jgi:hypothetical protein
MIGGGVLDIGDQTAVMKRIEPIKLGNKRHTESQEET